MDSKLTTEISGVKKYKDPTYKDKKPEVTVNDITKGEEVMVGNQVIRPIKFEHLSKANQKLITEKGKGWITRNSPCPCSSGKRFKSCCMELVK